MVRKRKRFYPAGYHLKRTIDISDAANARHAMKIADFLDWKVTVEDIYVASPENGDLTYSPVVFQKAVVRRDDKYSKNHLDVYAIVSTRYYVLRNDDCADSIDKLTESFNATFTTATEYEGGRTCISINGSREWRHKVARSWLLRIHVWNSHDRSRRFSGEVTIYDQRLDAYLMHFDEAFKIIHKVSAKLDDAEKPRKFKEKADQAVIEAVARMNERMDDLNEKSILLASREITGAELDMILKRIFVIQDSFPAEKANDVQDRRSNVIEIYNNEPKLEDYRGTAWAAYVALVLHLDHRENPSSGPRDYLDTDWANKDKAFEIICKEFIRKK